MSAPGQLFKYYKIIATKNTSSLQLWGTGALMIASYPFIVTSFTHATTQAISAPSAIAQLWSFILSSALFAPSVFGLTQLQKAFLDNPSHVATGAMLHILVCVPVLYTITVLATYIFGISHLTKIIWFSGATLFVASAALINPLAVKPLYPSWLRFTHGVLAALFIIVFAGIHILNHISAIWSPALHGKIQGLLQTWYLARAMEPLIFILWILLVTSGIYMASHHIRSASRYFKRLQTASGSFLGLFLCTHTTAILYARSQGIETNWYYASGEQGLLFSYHFLIPYYTLALLCFSLHGALAVRQIAIAHQISSRTTQQLYFVTRLIGLITTLIIMTAALGFSISKLSI